MTPNKKRKAVPHDSFLDDGATNAHEHGERPVATRDDELLGTSGSHTPAPDNRNEEPFGELADA